MSMDLRIGSGEIVVSPYGMTHGVLPDLRRRQQTRDAEKTLLSMLHSRYIVTEPQEEAGRATTRIVAARRRRNSSRRGDLYRNDTLGQRAVYRAAPGRTRPEPRGPRSDRLRGPAAHRQTKPI